VDDVTRPQPFWNETNHLYGVLDARLADRPFVAGASGL
jgi:hypothetical protein